MKRLIFFTLVLASCQMAFSQGARMTAFDPATDGFQFINSFRNIVVSEIDLVTAGLCGGMAYSALDYYYSSREIPTQSYRPADNSTLRNYIYNRQNTSTFENIDKWTELFVNPFGWRTNEFFNWGLQGYGGGRLQELKSEIDAGRPVPLGLFAGGNGGDAGHHQVLAIGYDCGRYKGDLGNYKTDFKIYIYDPNYPTETMVLRASPSTHDYYYEDKDDKRWMTYFVDKKYRKNLPPVIASPNYPKDGKVHEIVLCFYTGNDDLRGGNDNVSATIEIQNTTKESRNLNQSLRWVGYSVHYVPIRLDQPIDKSDIKKINLSTNFRGGFDGDNWNLFKFWVVIKGGNVNERIGWWEGRENDQGNEISPLVRFTGSRKTWSTGTLSSFKMKMVANTMVNASVPVIPTTPSSKNPKVVDPKTAKPGVKPNKAVITHNNMVIKPATKPIPVKPIKEEAVKNLVLTLKTGNDDLRSGSRANVYILKKDGKNMYFSLNNGKGWGNNAVKTITKVPLGSTKPSDIVGVRIIFKSGSGISADNWNLQEFDLSYTTYSGQKRSLLKRKGNPLFRFTGSKNKLEMKVTPKS
ncbi:MAG: hypothetical protein AAF502_14760 [Bacteroidota bacterium]